VLPPFCHLVELVRVQPAWYLDWEHVGFRNEYNLTGRQADRPHS